MAKFKAIQIVDLAPLIPGWNEMALKSQFDMDNYAKMLEALDTYGEQNGMQFFQTHNRNNRGVIIFKLKE